MRSAIILLCIYALVQVIYVGNWDSECSAVVATCENLLASGLTALISWINCLATSAPVVHLPQALRSVKTRWHIFFYIQGLRTSSRKQRHCTYTLYFYDSKHHSYLISDVKTSQVVVLFAIMRVRKCTQTQTIWVSKVSLRRNKVEISWKRCLAVVVWAVLMQIYERPWLLTPTKQWQ